MSVGEALGLSATAVDTDVRYLGPSRGVTAPHQIPTTFSHPVGILEGAKDMLSPVQFWEGPPRNPQGRGRPVPSFFIPINLEW